MAEIRPSHTRELLSESFFVVCSHTSSIYVHNFMIPPCLYRVTQVCQHTLTKHLFFLNELFYLHVYLILQLLHEGVNKPLRAIFELNFCSFVQLFLIIISLFKSIIQYVIQCWYMFNYNPAWASRLPHPLKTESLESVTGSP